MTSDITSEVDRDCIKKLKALLAGQFSRLVQSFLQNTDGYIDAIGVALQSGNQSEAIAVAHKMKSSCGQFGLLHLQSLAKQIEYSETLDNATLLALHQELKPAFVRAIDYMKQQEFIE
jgi:HPt (histidine-containing phosphotransfer) domain-containing protein